MRPLAEVVDPGSYLPGPYGGQRVETPRGHWIDDDFLVVSSRFNGGVEGYWITGQFRFADTAEPTSLAVALGWVPTRDEADAVAAELAASVALLDADAFPLTGRIIADEGPKLPPRGAPLTEMTSMSPAALLGWWSDT